jgi:glyoxylase-like metal-dependent hydrolase (beta-lactamase superfamily II)
MKLLKGVYLAGGGAFGYSHSNDCNIYLIDGGTEMALIDTGGGAGAIAIVDNIKSFGFDPKKIKIAFNTHSHFDHILGNKKIRELTGCKIAAHVAEAQAIEKLDPLLVLTDMAKEQGLEINTTNVDLSLKDGDFLKIGSYSLEIIHTPGHTPGGISIFTEIEGNRILFSGDTVSAQGKLGFINGPGFNLKEWKESLAKLVKLKIDILLPGHGTFVLSKGFEHIQLYSDKMNSPWRNIVTSIDF